MAQYTTIWAEQHLFSLKSNKLQLKKKNVFQAVNLLPQDQ